MIMKYIVFYHCPCDEEWIGLHNEVVGERCPECNYLVHPSESYEAKRVGEFQNKIGDLQELIGRAYKEIDGHFEALCVDGYGPLELVNDLQKARNGDEYKNLVRLLEAEHKAITHLEEEKLELKGLR